MTDSCPTGELTKQKLGALSLAEDVECDPFDGPVQVAVMIAALVRGGNALVSRPHFYVAPVNFSFE